jgi:hypothetical protein
MHGCLTSVGLYGACGHAVDERGRVNDPDWSRVFFLALDRSLACVGSLESESRLSAACTIKANTC